MHHHVGGHNFADAAFDGVGNGVHLLETGGARNADRNVHEVLVSGAPHSHALGGKHAFEPLNFFRTRSCKPSGAESSSASSVRFPSREPTQITIAATTSAARGTAICSQAMPQRCPAQTAPMPK